MRSLAISAAALGLTTAGCGLVLGIEDLAGDGAGGSTSSSNISGGGDSTSASMPASSSAALTGTGSAGGDCGDTLSSPESCGECGHSCLGEGCVDGACKPITIAAATNPRAIAADDAHVFWVDDAGVHLAGLDGIPVELVSMSVTGTAIAVNATNVVWADGDDVFKALADGTGVKPLTNTLQPGARGVALGATEAYYTFGAEIRHADLGNGAAPVVLGVPPQTQPTAIALDATSVYWAELASSAGSVKRAALPDGAGGEVPLAADQDYPVAVEVHAGKVYWINAKADELRRIGADGREPELVASGQLGATGLAVDDHGIYWTTSTAVMRKTLDLQGQLELADVPGAGHLALNSTPYVYVTTPGAIVKVPK